MTINSKDATEVQGRFFRTWSRASWHHNYQQRPRRNSYQSSYQPASRVGSGPIVLLVGGGVLGVSGAGCLLRR